MNILISPQASLAVGIALMLLGASFFYKSAVAVVKGSVLYWAGFLPLTVVSPFFIHLPASKNSMIKRAEGIWVQTVMAPIFVVVGMLCSLSGAEYAGYPAVDLVNLTLHGGKAGAPILSFSKTRGFRFPVFSRSSPAVGKLFNAPVNLESHQEIVPRNNQSLQQELDSK